LLDRHADPDHHRAVFTLAGEPGEVRAAVEALAVAAVDEIDLGPHTGAHPRLGSIDVVPFVPLVARRDDDGPAGPPRRRLVAAPDLAPAVEARDRFADWAANRLSLPCFLYGPLPDGSVRTLPEVRRRAFDDLSPDTGPRRPHPTAGATAVGARPLLVAYNLWVDGGDAPLVRRVAAALRRPAVRALGLVLGDRLQVSCNLLDPLVVGPAAIHDAATALLAGSGAGVAGAELVGLVPASVLDRVPPHRWSELDLRPEATLEARWEAASATRRRH
jgi:glutamate formiminotransferase